MINGQHKGRAISGELGLTNAGDPQVAILCEVTEDGPFKGHRGTWFGYFTPKSEERTLESLMLAGWDGVALDKLEGLGTTEIGLAFEPEVSQKDGKTYPKLAWINRLGGGGVQMKNKMSPAQAAGFAEKMKGRAAGVRQKLEQGGDTSFDYGARGKAGADLPPGV